MNTLVNFFRELLTQPQRIPTKYWLVIGAIILLTLYGCTTEKSVVTWLEKHPETMERIDTTRENHRVIIKSEQKQLQVGRNVLQYNPYKPNDSLQLKGGRFITTVKNVGDKVVITTRFNGVDTTFITTKTVYKFPNVWIGKFTALQATLKTRTYFLWAVIGTLAALLTASVLVLLVLLGARKSPLGILGSLIG